MTKSRRPRESGDPESIDQKAYGKNQDPKAFGISTADTSVIRHIYLLADFFCSRVAYDLAPWTGLAGVANK
jgi:hypothetical protein